MIILLISLSLGICLFKILFTISDYITHQIKIINKISSVSHEQKNVPNPIFDWHSNLKTISYKNDMPNIETVDKELPEEISTKFKSYMDYRTIKNQNSKQWELQQSAITDENGFRRYNGLYMIALGTYYSPQSGMEFEIEFDSGKIISCITGDIKDDKHTDSTNRYSQDNNCLVEFIVDTKEINKMSRIMGDISYSGMGGDIIRISEIISIDDAS